MSILKNYLLLPKSGHKLRFSNHSKHVALNQRAACFAYLVICRKPLLMNRRKFILTTGAAVTFLNNPVSAHVVLPKYDLPPEFLPKVVKSPIRAAPYEIHVIPNHFALYWTQPNNRAIRYTVGVGRPGLYEAGEFYVGAKRKWPSWTPTPGMLRREPEKYGPLRKGMPGGLKNPLGARALYLFQPGLGDTLLRVHGTNNPKTLGRAVSNGCARLVNDQIVELYDKVPMRTRVVLHPVT